MTELETDDFQKIFAFMPSLVNVNLRFAGQMKDNVLDYMLAHNVKVRRLHLDAANLVSDACWRRVFRGSGSRLESLKLSNLDSSFDDETVEEMCKCCPDLRRLKLKLCWKTGDRSLEAISTLKHVEHLSLNFVKETKEDTLLKVVENLGANLRTLSLEGFSEVSDRLLACIHQKCSRLAKLRITDNAVCTDKGFASVFQDWQNAPLTFVDVSSTRDLDNSNPDGPPDAVGLASEGFTALMRHSGATIQSLNLASCRHISHVAMEEVFTAHQKYPSLQELDVSFLPVMDDFLVNCIFRCCPALKKLVAFACFNVRDVRVPVGVALIGGLKAQDSIVIEGSYRGTEPMVFRVSDPPLHGLIS